MIWAAWAIQGTVFFLVCVIATIATAIVTIDNPHIGKVGYGIAAASLIIAAASFIISGWVAWT